MKAIVKFTNEEIDVIRGETIDGITYYCHIQFDGHFIRFAENQLEFPKPTTTQPPIDWEQRRYEIAKEVLPVFAELSETHSAAMARAAVYYADALIAELKKGAEE